MANNFVDFQFGFKLTADNALDYRFVGESKAFLNELISLGAVYEGLRVFVKDENTFYTYMKDSDGAYKFLLDKGEKGDKGDPGQDGAPGNDGVGIADTKIEDGNLYIKYTNSEDFVNLGQVKGSDGRNGVTPTISIGTVETGDAGSRAEVSKTGSDTAAVFKFKIPQGIKGDKGDSGAPGNDGKTPVISAAATIDDSTGTPQVTVEKSGTELAPEFSFNFTGLKGAKGDQGIQGLQGPKGDSGDKGDTGDRGPKGDPGTNAVITGAEATVDGTSSPNPSVIVKSEGTESSRSFKFSFSGLKGAKGDKGDPGKDGTGVTIKGSYESEEELRSAHPTGIAGDAYLVNGNLYVWASEDWKNVGQIQGSAGPQGPSGVDGTAATISIGSVTSGEPGSNPIVNNSGTANAAILDFVIPQGAKGAQGDRGPQGPQGVQGDPGATLIPNVKETITLESGKAAEVSVDTTTDVTKASFTFKIPKGAKGDQGPEGPQGPQGDQGPQGPQGDIGPAGPSGATGAAAGFGTPTATIDANYGIPSVEVEASGENTEKVFAFKFKNLKGAPGKDANDLNFLESKTDLSGDRQILISGVKDAEHDPIATIQMKALTTTDAEGKRDVATRYEFQNIIGNGIESVEQVESPDDSGVNECTLTFYGLVRSGNQNSKTFTIRTTNGRGITGWSVPNNIVTPTSTDTYTYAESVVSYSKGDPSTVKIPIVVPVDGGAHSLTLSKDSVTPSLNSVEFGTPDSKTGKSSVKFNITLPAVYATNSNVIPSEVGDISVTNSFFIRNQQGNFQKITMSIDDGTL